MEMNERMEQLEKRIAWLEKLKAEDERAILILHEQNENLQMQIEKIKERLGRPDAKTNDRCEGQTPPKENAGNDGERKNEPSAPEFLSTAAMKRVLQDEPVLRVIASLTLGPDYEQKMEMARKTVERRMQK